MTDVTLDLLREYGEMMYLAGRLHAHLELQVSQPAEAPARAPVTPMSPRDTSVTPADPLRTPVVVPLPVPEPRRTPQPVETPGDRVARGPLKGRILDFLKQGPATRADIIAAIQAQRPGTSTDAVRTSIYTLYRDGHVIANDDGTFRLSKTR
jgi:hypothetical protein